VKVVGPQLLERLHLDEAVPIGEHPEPAQLIMPVANQPTVVAFTDAGRFTLLRWELAGKKPRNLENFLSEGMNGEKVVKVIPLPAGEAATNASVVLLSSDWRFKRQAIKDFQELSERATTALKHKDGLSLKREVICCKKQKLELGNCLNRLLRFSVDNASLPFMGINTQCAVLLRFLREKALRERQRLITRATCC